MTKLVRVESHTYETLTQLSQKLRIPKTKVLSLAIAKLKRDHIIDAANQYYENLKKDPSALKEELTER